VISNGISIILALLETRAAVTSYNNMDNNMDNVYGGNFCGQSAANNDEISPEDAARQEAILTATLNSILPWLDSFTRLLINPPNQTPMRTTAGLLDPPLGQTRLCKYLVTMLWNSVEHCTGVELSLMHFSKSHAGKIHVVVGHTCEIKHQQPSPTANHPQIPTSQ
jgi:hypothetical protein